MKNQTKANGIPAFGRLIKERQKALGLTQETLSEKSFQSDRQIRNILHGVSMPKLDTFLYLCKACQINLGELQFLVDTLQPPEKADPDYRKTRKRS